MTGFVFLVTAIAALLGWLGVILVCSLHAGRSAAPGRRRQPASPNDNSADGYIGGAAYFSQNGGDGECGGSTDGASSNSCDAGSAGSGVDTGGGGSSCD